MPIPGSSSRGLDEDLSQELSPTSLACRLKQVLSEELRPVQGGSGATTLHWDQPTPSMLMNQDIGWVDTSNHRPSKRWTSTGSLSGTSRGNLAHLLQRAAPSVSLRRGGPARRPQKTPRKKITSGSRRACDASGKFRIPRCLDPMFLVAISLLNGMDILIYIYICDMYNICVNPDFVV